MPRDDTIVKPSDKPEENDAADEEAETVLMPGDAIQPIAQMAGAHSKPFHCL